MNTDFKGWITPLVFAVTLWPGVGSAMGLRSFVALPLEKGGTVVRFQATHNTDTEAEVLTTNLAYGIGARQTFFLGLPYRLSPAGDDRLGNLSALYRHTVLQKDTSDGTSRLGLLGGVVIPTESGRDGQLQAGAVATFVHKRNEWDLDVLYRAGLGDAGDTARYDASWQYRLSPAIRSGWGISPELYSVLELNGRWQDGSSMLHQVTAGLQWIHRRWVLEGGVYRDLNRPEDTSLIISTRLHF